MIGGEARNAQPVQAHSSYSTTYPLGTVLQLSHLLRVLWGVALLNRSIVLYHDFTLISTSVPKSRGLPSPALEIAACELSDKPPNSILTEWYRSRNVKCDPIVFTLYQLPVPM